MVSLYAGAISDDDEIREAAALIIRLGLLTAHYFTESKSKIESSSENDCERMEGGKWEQACIIFFLLACGECGRMPLAEAEERDA